MVIGVGQVFLLRMDSQENVLGRAAHMQDGVLAVPHIVPHICTATTDAAQDILVLNVKKK